MPNIDKNESIEAFENKAVHGKPYLDIDRVITEGRSGLERFMKNEYTNANKETN